MTKEELKAYMKAYYQTHKEDYKAYQKAHKEELKAYNKAYYEAHKEEHLERCKSYQKAHKEEFKAYMKAYQKSDLNSLGKTKNSIRKRSLYILKKSGIKIPDYQIHHCFTYNDPSKFIYCSKELHVKIHQFLRDNNINADSDHYEQIKHLLDEKVITFGL